MVHNGSHWLGVLQVCGACSNVELASKPCTGASLVAHSPQQSKTRWQAICRSILDSCDTSHGAGRTFRLLGSSWAVASCGAGYPWSLRFNI